MINDREKQEKILNFNIIVGNQNNAVATEFLSLGHWDVSEAINIYLYTVSSPNNNNIINQNNSQICKYITEYSFVNEGIFTKVSSLFKSPFLKNNAECCIQFIGKIKNLVKSGEVFANLLKTNKGVIILYNKDTFYKLIQQLDIINNDNQDNYLNKVVMYPVFDNSIEGNNLINSIKINRFPCYLFCQSKTKDVFYIIDKMEGIFYLQTFKSTLFPQMNNSNMNNINNIINPVNNEANKNVNEQNKNESNIINNMGENNIQKDNKINNIINNNSNNNNEIHIKDENKNENKNNNDNFSLLNNNNQMNNKKKDEQRKIKYRNSNLFGNPINNISDNNKSNINSKSNISQPIQPQQKKEYIPDYRDYEFDDNQINPGFNQNQPQPPISSNLNDNFDINEDLLSDSQLRKKQENDMKELERMAAEKEKKEREEKEKIRKEEEEKKKREEKEKEDKEIFSMLIPPEPDDDNPDKCVIIFRLPDGEKNIQRKFLKTDKIAVLYDYVKSLGKDIYSEEESNNFSLIQPFPFKNFENKLNNTLEEEGLFPNSVLQIKENE